MGPARALSSVDDNGDEDMIITSGPPQVERLEPKISSAKEEEPSSAMKLQAVAAALCLVLLVASSESTLPTAVYKLAPCIAASKNANVAPSKQCSTNMANLGKGQAGAKCLCSLLSSPLAKSQSVVPRIALAIPQKCRIADPKGFVCQGIRVRGS